MSAATSQRTVLHVSPHPDDETLGGGVALALLAAAGWRVVNLACSLGRPADHARRSTELADAIGRWGWVDERMDPPAGISRGDDLEAAKWRITAAVARAIATHDPDLVVTPQPEDGHHGHELVAAATFEAMDALAAFGGRVPVWWAWGLWRDLPAPNLYVPFGEAALAQVEHSLAAYAGEISRNDFSRLPRARGALGAVLGTERVFGYGAASASDEPFADLLTEMRFEAGSWQRSEPRLLDIASV